MAHEMNTLLGILRGFVLGTPADVSGADPEKLLALAQIHNVGGILGYMDMSHKLFDDPALRGTLRNACMGTMASFAQRGAMADQLFATLEQHGITHCPVKGYAVRQCYPVPELRSFSDVDFLILPQDREKTHGLMLSLGFTAENDWEPVYSYRRGREYYEIHTRLMEVDLTGHGELQGYFDKAWEHTQPVSDFGWRLKMEFHFLYLLTHIAKHVQSSGAGIRMYLDIAVWLRAYGDAMDWAWLMDELKTLQLWEFGRTVLSCVESWFGVPCPAEFERIGPELQRRFLDYTMEAGIFGKHGREIGTTALKQQQDGSRAAALWKRAFPNAESIESRYTYLQGRHWLLPVAWVHRLFKTDVSLRDHAREAATILTADGDEVARLRDLCRDIGL